MSNTERWRTRDLLLEYDRAIMPPRPRAAGLGSIYTWLDANQVDQGEADVPPDPTAQHVNTVYPWENTGLIILSNQLYTLAAKSGYTGTSQEFYKYFGSYLERNRQEILFETYNNFPQVGVANMLYFDLDSKILYYWDNEYIPVNAMLIANTILDGGDA